MSYILKQPETGRCLQCGTEIYGRQGKKFCSQQCKNAYHNNINHHLRQAKSVVVNGLNKNHEILDFLIKSNTRSISIDRMHEMGFKEGYVTGYKKSLYGHTEEYCYEIAYVRTLAKIFRIRRKE